MIDMVRNTGQAIARHLDQRRANVDAFHPIAETCEILAHPTRSAAYIQNATARRQTERHSDVCKVAKVTVRFRVHAVALMLVRFVRQVVERLGSEVMTA